MSGNTIFTKTTNLWRHWLVLWKRYPLCRGMVTYSIVWPISSICQQKIAGLCNGIYVLFSLFFYWLMLSTATLKLWNTLCTFILFALLHILIYEKFKVVGGKWERRAKRFMTTDQNIFFKFSFQSKNTYCNKINKACWAFLIIIIRINWYGWYKILKYTHMEKSNLIMLKIISSTQAFFNLWFVIII